MPELSFFEKKAREIIRMELKRQSLTIAQLAERLSEIGTPEAIQSLGVKISRGKFQLSFYLQCMSAMGREDVSFKIPSRGEALKNKPPINRNRPRALIEEEARRRLLQDAKGRPAGKTPLPSLFGELDATSFVSTPSEENTNEDDRS